MPRTIVWLLVVALIAACRPALAPTPTASEATVSFLLQSSAFMAGGTIPKQHTCDGADQSPPLAWSQLPGGTKSLSLIVEDPDAPGGTFVHWVLYNLPADGTTLSAGVPKQAELPNGARQGRNGFRRVGYGGPCPPPGSPHHYVFHLYALSGPVDLTSGAAASELRTALAGRILGEAQLTGVYGR
jgi:Raf kinase inhibitor-like YbhB/YbcL family protein